MPLLIEDIIESVAQAPGTSLGVEMSALLKTWDAACETVATAMVNRKSIIIPQFAHFVVQKQEGASGTWGVKTSYIPNVAFLPAFCESYGLRKTPPFRTAHLGASVPTIINPSLVSPKAGVPRHAVTNSLKDIVRGIGANIAQGNTLSLDMGFCRIDFRSDRSYTVSWEESFTKEFVTAYVPCAPPSRASSASRGTTPRVPVRPSSARVPVPGTPTGRLNNVQGAEASSVQKATQTEGRPTTARIPAPPAAAPRASGYPEPPTPRPSSSRSDRSPSPRSSRPPSASVDRASTIRSTLERLKHMDSFTPYQKRLNRKTLYRQLRNKAYEESWENQLSMKRQIATEEKQQDKEKVEAFKEFLLETQHRERDAAIRKQLEEKQMDDLNLSLRQAREPLAVPRIVEAGDIFDARQPTFSAKADKTFLATQIKLAQDRRDREKAEDLVFGQRARQLAEDYEAEKKQVGGKRRENQLKLREQYVEQIELRKAEEAKYKRELTTGGALLFSGEDDARAEEADRRRVLEQSRAVQDINKKNALEVAAREKEELLGQRKKLRRDQKDYAEREKLLRTQRKREKLATQQSLRDAWDESIDNRKRRDLAEKEAMRRWREHNYLKNESSEDDD